MSCAAAAMIVALTFAAEAAPPETARDHFLTRVKKVLPKDWTLELSALPPGVEGLALGPKTGAGRAVLVATRLDADDEKLDRAVLEQKLGVPLRFEQDGAWGTREVTAQIERDGEVYLVLHLFGGRLGPWSISLIAPRALYEQAYKAVSIAAERLGAAQKATVKLTNDSNVKTTKPLPQTAAN